MNSKTQETKNLLRKKLLGIQVGESNLEEVEQIQNPLDLSMKKAKESPEVIGVLEDQPSEIENRTGEHFSHHSGTSGFQPVYNETNFPVPLQTVHKKCHVWEVHKLGCSYCAVTQFKQTGAIQNSAPNNGIVSSSGPEQKKLRLTSPALLETSSVTETTNQPFGSSFNSDISQAPRRFQFHVADGRSDILQADAAAQQTEEAAADVSADPDQIRRYSEIQESVIQFCASLRGNISKLSTPFESQEESADRRAQARTRSIVVAIHIEEESKDQELRLKPDTDPQEQNSGSKKHKRQSYEQTETNSSCTWPVNHRLTCSICKPDGIQAAETEHEPIDDAKPGASRERACNFQCDQCDQSFGQNEKDFNQHMLTHHGVEKLTCPSCCSSFFMAKPESD